MARASDVVRVAAAEVGVTESPANSNCVKYNDWYYGRQVRGAAYPWCAAFVSWVLAQAGAGALAARSASCPAIKSDAQRRGIYHSGSAGIAPGDLVLYQFDRDSDPDHIGIVESVSGSSIVAIEGNTSLTSNDNGGAVMRRTRSKGLIMGYVKPAYDGASAPAVDTRIDTVREVQQWLNRAYGAGLSVDGIYGPQTRKAIVRVLQRAIGTGVDGIVGWRTRRALPTLSVGTGGDAVRAAQALLVCKGYAAAYVDGDFGDGTKTAVKAYQRRRGLSKDGIIGKRTWAALLA